MKLILKAKHIAHASIRTNDFSLKFKLKSAIIFYHPDLESDVEIEVSAQEIISTYSAISALPKEKYEVINNEMKTAFMSQLLDSNGQPISDEAGSVVMWILKFREEMQSELQNELLIELNHLKN